MRQQLFHCLSRRKQEHRMEIPQKYDPSEALRQLKDADPKVRKAGAFWISHMCFCESNQWTEGWLRDQCTTDALLPLLDDEPDVANMAINALWGITVKHRRDQRVYSSAIQLLKSDRPNTLLVAGCVALALSGEDCCDAVLELLKDPSLRVRGQIVFHLKESCGSWSPEAKERVRASLLLALHDRSAEVRGQAAWLLGTVVGREEDVSAIENANRRSKANQRMLDAAIHVLKERLSKSDRRIE